MGLRVSAESLSPFSPSGKKNNKTERSCGTLENSFLFDRASKMAALEIFSGTDRRGP
jgi:hypothetical protein